MAARLHLTITRTTPLPALAGSQQIYQAPGFGPVRTLVVGSLWQDLVGGSKRDLALIRVPPGSRRVLVLESADDLSGTAASVEQEEHSWVLDPGVHPHSVNIPRGGPRLWVAVDPTDAESTQSTARIKVMGAG